MRADGFDIHIAKRRWYIILYNIIIIRVNVCFSYMIFINIFFFNKLISKRIKTARFAYYFIHDGNIAAKTL